LPGDIFKVPVVEEEHVVKGLAPQAADKSFANRIHVRCPHRRLDHPHTRAFGDAVEYGAELLVKLGIRISERQVSRLMPRRARTPPSQTWRAFLTNHVGILASIDFFTVPTATFRVLFVFVVLAHDRRRVCTSTSPTTRPLLGLRSKSSKRSQFFLQAGSTNTTVPGAGTGFSPPQGTAAP
jgi:hypothetical protein